MAKPRNIILLVCDSLRYDSMYNKKFSMPYCEEHGIQFHEARSSACWTLPATTCLFTGKLPHEHGANAQSRDFYPELPTLAEQLKEEGYYTMQATANVVTTHIFGLDRGFDEVFRVWKEVDPKFRKLLRFLVICGKPRIRKMVVSSKDFMNEKMSEDLEMATTWTQNTYADIFDHVKKRIAENEKIGKPTFCFINLMEAHFPYHAGDTFHLTANGMMDKFREARGLFDTLNVKFMKTGEPMMKPHIEHLIRERQNTAWQILQKPLDNFMKEMHSQDGNLCVMSADHGDTFGEMDWHYHFNNVTDAGNRVPLIWLDDEKSEAGKKDYPVSSRFIYNDILRKVKPKEAGSESLFTPSALNLPVMQSYWYNSNGQTLDRYRYNQMAFVADDQRYVYRDDVDLKASWLTAPVQNGVGKEPVFEKMNASTNPVEELLKDKEQKDYLRKMVKDFKEFSEKVKR